MQQFQPNIHSFLLLKMKTSIASISVEGKGYFGSDRINDLQSDITPRTQVPDALLVSKVQGHGDIINSFFDSSEPECILDTRSLSSKEDYNSDSEDNDWSDDEMEAMQPIFDLEISRRGLAVFHPLQTTEDVTHELFLALGIFNLKERIKCIEMRMLPLNLKNKQ